MHTKILMSKYKSGFWLNHNSSHQHRHPRLCYVQNLAASNPIKQTAKSCVKALTFKMLMMMVEIPKIKIAFVTTGSFPYVFVYV